MLIERGCPCGKKTTAWSADLWAEEEKPLWGRGRVCILFLGCSFLCRLFNSVKQSPEQIQQWEPEGRPCGLVREAQSGVTTW